MRKIHDFSSFSALYEADAAGLLAKPTEASKLYDQTLGLILTTALNSYSSELTFPVKSYDANIDADMTSVKSAPVADKPGALTKIVMKVKQASADNTTKGAPDAIDAWVAAGTKGATGDKGPPGDKGEDGVAPTISVTSTFKSGPAAVSVSKIGSEYKFSFTLPVISSSFEDMFVCFNRGEITVLAKESSSCSGTKYKMLLAPVSGN
jgi:hypothetical protein